LTHTHDQFLNVFQRKPTNRKMNVSKGDNS
jgi:hypothetical protein